jgi:hypothetical protein
MAILATGSVLQFGNSSTANTGNVSTAVTVPADADFMLVHISAYDSTIHYYSGGGMTFTKGGSQVAMTAFGGGNGDGNTSFWQSAGFYLVAPDTGSGKTLAWDWAGTAAAADPAHNYAISFWKGVHQTTPVRDSDSTSPSNSFPFTTPTLTALSGDKIVAHLGGFVSAQNGSGAVSAWTNATSFAEPAHSTAAELSIATADPTGNQTVGTSTVTGYSEGALLAIVLQPAAAAAASSLLWTPSRSFQHMLIR